MRRKHKSLDGIDPRHVCYSDWWLADDMENMSFLFEYCEDYMKELYSVDYHIDMIKFITDFMLSDCRALMEIGHPKLLSQAAIDTLEDYIRADCNGDYAKYRLDGTQLNYYDYQLYWVGGIYAYIHYMTKLPSDEIIEILPVKHALHDYICGHQLSEEGYFERVSYKFKKEDRR